MEAAVQADAPSQQVLRDARGVVIGRIEHRKLTGKFLARDARGRLLGIYDAREGLTRDASGRIVAKGNLLAGMFSGW